MELIKNKASGKFFIIIDDNGGSDLLVITPEGKIRNLERHLFGPQVLAEPGHNFFDNQLTKPQLDKYVAYSGDETQF